MTILRILLSVLLAASSAALRAELPTERYAPAQLRDRKSVV